MKKIDCIASIYSNDSKNNKTNFSKQFNNFDIK